MARLLAALLLAIACGVGCGGRAPAPTPPPDHAASGSAAGSGSSASAGTTGTDDKRPSDDACTAMIDHSIDLDVADRPADQRPTAADLESVRRELRASLLPGCRELTRAQVACVTAATTKVAALACTE